MQIRAARAGAGTACQGRAGPAPPANRRPFRAAGALALLLFGDGVVVQAQTPPPLVSNIGQDLDFYGGLGSTADRVQRFTTGTNPGGYTLTGIDLSLRSEDTGTIPPTVTLHRGSATGTRVADLSGPAALTAGTTDTYRFTPTGTVRLSGSTNYWVVAKGGSNDIDWTQTTSNAEDATPADGWTIQYESGFWFGGTSHYDVYSRALRLSVHGTAREGGANTSATGVAVATGLAPLGDNLQWVLHFDNAAQQWQSHSPAAPSAGTLTELVPGRIYWIGVNADQTAVLGGVSRTLMAGLNQVAR